MITLADVQAALERIRQSIYLSPCTLSATFSQLTGNSIYLKLDNLQRTGAFKERGALNKLLTMTPQERDRGVIAAPTMTTPVKKPSVAASSNISLLSTLSMMTRSSPARAPLALRCCSSIPKLRWSWFPSAVAA